MRYVSEKLYRLLASVLVLMTLAVYVSSCTKSQAELAVDKDLTKLTKEEVVETFIGTPWHNPSGAFLFRENGTYTFKKFGKQDPLGTWDYRIEPDGTLVSDYTNYTFYRSNGGFEYFHSRSFRYNNAKPNQPPFL